MSRVALFAAVAVLLAACAEVPVTPETAPPPAAVARAATPRAAPPDSVAAAIEAYRKRVRAHIANGDLASAAVDYHVLTLLAPDDPTFRAELAAVRSGIARNAAESLQAAHAALRVGDAERATAAFLRTLALDPENAEAAQQLRELEHRKLARIQGDRAARVRAQEAVAPARMAPAAPDNGAGYDLEQRIELFNAGDTAGGLRELKAWVDVHADERAARQRIGGMVFDRGRDVETSGDREQALSLYEAAVALRGGAAPTWTPRIQTLRKALSSEYYDRGTRAERTDLAAAIRALETSLRYDPTNLKASARLAQARTAQARLQAIEKSRPAP